MHMSVAFVLMYWITGSVAFGGLAAVVEPLCNVLLLPLHEHGWQKLRDRIRTGDASYMIKAFEKISQASMHFVVAFAVMYWATGSLAFGGLAALLEPVCNVILLPFHDRIWEKLRVRIKNNQGAKWLAA